MIFSDDAAAGRLIQNMIALLIISLLASFIIASVFWLIKRVAMPHIMPVIYMGTLVNLANNHGSANAYDAIGEASFGKKNLVVIE